MNQIGFYSAGFIVSLLIMTAAFILAALIFVRSALTDRRGQAGSGKNKSEKNKKGQLKMRGEFRITEHVISVHSDHFI